MDIPVLSPSDAFHQFIKSKQDVFLFYDLFTPHDFLSYDGHFVESVLNHGDNPLKCVVELWYGGKRRVLHHFVAVPNESHSCLIDLTALPLRSNIYIKLEDITTNKQINATLLVCKSFRKGMSSDT